MIKYWYFDILHLENIVTLLQFEAHLQSWPHLIYNVC